VIVDHRAPRRMSPDDGAHWFVGYYDKQPWSADGSRLLAHRAAFCDRFPGADDPCEVGFIDLARGEFTRVATTHAWNWQQGAMLQWFEHEGDGCLLFNDRDGDGAVIARVVDPGGGERARFPMGVYAVAPDRSYALTLDFGRLSRLRPEYGYPGLTDAHEKDPNPSASGVWRLDLRTGETGLLASIRDLAAHDGVADSIPHQHINHLMIGPGGTRACVLHRFERYDGILASRLFTFGANDGSDRRLLMSGMVSHYDWIDDASILAWGGARKLLGSGTGRRGAKQRVLSLARRTLKPIYYALGKPRILMNKIMKDSYLVIPDREGAPATPFASGELTCDGHCTFFRGGQGAPRWVVTDGYPDLKGRQPLFVWDRRSDKGFEVGRFATPRALDGPVRVDLHPRWSRDAGEICIDSAMSGSRAIYSIGVADLTRASD